MSEAEARAALVRARRHMAQLQRELSGCDWCCGGGDEMMSRLRADEAKALAILSAAGVTPPTPCVECSYYDALEGSDYCERCKGGLEEAMRRRIRQLSSEAGEAGDADMVASCERALAGDAAALDDVADALDMAEAAAVGFDGSRERGWPSKCIRCNAVLDTDEGAQTGVCPDCWTWDDGEVSG